MRSLRFRLTVWYVVWLSVVFISFGSIIYFASKHHLENTLKQLLFRRVAQVAGLLQNPGLIEDPARLRTEIETRFAPEVNGRFIRITHSNGKELYRSQAPQDASFDPETIPSAGMPKTEQMFARYVLSDGHAVFVALTPTGVAEKRYLVEFGASAESVQSVLQQLLVAFGIALPALVLVAVGGGYFLIRQAMQPVDQVIKTAEQISSHNLRAGVPVAATGDELQRLSTALNNTFRRLDEAFQHNKRFMADASHELRTPLTVVQCQLEAVRELTAENVQAREIVGNTLEEVQRLTRIVEELFTICRLDAGEAHEESVHFDLGSLVAVMTEQMSVLADDKKIRITRTVARVDVYGDRARLKQVAVNLINNAIIYTPAGGKIHVAVYAEHEKAVLEVVDDGIGIPAEALPHVFERFYRVDKARSRAGGGAGLGLSIVRSICNAHGGTVEVESSEGKGSRFIVKLPSGRGFMK
jgi:two-component system, OmpR family, sensor kinase